MVCGALTHGDKLGWLWGPPSATWLRGDSLVMRLSICVVCTLCLLCSHTGARTSPVLSDLAGAMLPFVCSLGQEAMGKRFDRRQKQTIALLQRYDEWDIIGFFL